MAKNIVTRFFDVIINFIIRVINSIKALFRKVFGMKKIEKIKKLVIRSTEKEDKWRNILYYEFKADKFEKKDLKAIKEDKNMSSEEKKELKKKVQDEYKNLRKIEKRMDNYAFSNKRTMGFKCHDEIDKKLNDINKLMHNVRHPKANNP